ncbi:MAG: glycosyltransferase family 9 protein [Planctomycetes bacterium]|nr:glycosyltransferase family 9 protein [Planctomycetota bacterium]
MAGPFGPEILDGRSLASRVHTTESPGLHTFFNPSLPPDERLRFFFSSFDCILSFWADADGVFHRQLESSIPGRVLAHPPRPGVRSRLHVSEHLAMPLRSLGVPFQPEFPLLPALNVHREAAAVAERNLGIPAGRPWIVIHPGSGSPRKNWPPDRFAELVSRLAGSRIGTPILVEGPADLAAVRAVRAALGNTPVIGLTLPTLTTLLGVLDRAIAYIGNDSGVSHLAAAAGTPSLILFGPTNPRQWRPLGHAVRVLRAIRPHTHQAIDAVWHALLALLSGAVIVHRPSGP